MMLAMTTKAHSAAATARQFGHTRPSLVLPAASWPYATKQAGRSLFGFEGAWSTQSIRPEVQPNEGSLKAEVSIG